VPKLFLKPQVWVSWILTSIVCLSGLIWPKVVFGQSSEHPAIVTVNKADLNFSLTPTTPSMGWEASALPANSLVERARQGQNQDVVVWARFYFDPSDFGANSLALYTENNREGLTIFLNGVEILRNGPEGNSRVMGWNRPYLAPLPASLLKAGKNEIVMRVRSKYNLNLSVGQAKIGTHADLVKHYNRQHTLRIAGPLAANVTMLFLTIGVLLLWLVRRQEHTLLWIALTGIFWFIRDYHFFAYEAPFEPRLFLEVSYYSIFFAVAASLSFCVDFLKLPNRRAIIISMFGLCIMLSIGQFISIQSRNFAGLVNLASLIITVGVTGLMIQSWRKNPTPDHPLLVAVVIAIILLSVHDLGRSASFNFWEGMGFHAQPFIGLLLFMVFLVSIGRRFVEALTDVEQANLTLERRVETARQDLAKSEYARRELEVQGAVESERERLMREMHDGIGSNLITALAIAKQADESPRTIHTLQRAISDLKITVDSLAPVEGDLVALLANFRHRLEPDLREAGIKCIWKVEACPPLPWLDAVNALQMLRIVQEAISNVLAHANAHVIEIGAWPLQFEGRDGIETWISDNGIGFDPSLVTNGRGIGNMRTRARSLAGEFQRSSVVGEGTHVKLWLPLTREVD
jgi:signal transduction histidine kinase